MAYPQPAPFAGLLLALLGVATLAQGQKLDCSEIDASVQSLRKGPVEQLRAVEALKRAPVSVVPCFVGNMNDTSPLRIRELEITAPPGVWEGTMHITPQTVAGLLGYLVIEKARDRLKDFDLGNDYDAPSPQTISKWRVWCVSTFPAAAAACNGKLL